MTLSEFVRLMRRHLMLLLIIPLCCLVGMIVYKATSQGSEISTATCTVYAQPRLVLNANGTISGATADSTLLTNDLQILATSHAVTNEAAREMGRSDLSGFSVSASSDTPRYITITLSGKEPNETLAAMRALVNSFKKESRMIADLDKITVVSQSSQATVVSPAISIKSLIKFGALACMGGLFFAVLLIVCLDAFDPRARSDQEVEEIFGAAVVSRLPHERSK